MTHEQAVKIVIYATAFLHDLDAAKLLEYLTDLRSANDSLRAHLAEAKAERDEAVAECARLAEQRDQFQKAHEELQQALDYRLYQAIHHRRTAKACRAIAVKFNNGDKLNSQPGWAERYWDLWMMGEINDEVAASLEQELGLEFVKPEEKQ